MTLIQRKLSAPPPPEQLLARPRLDTRLEALVERNRVVVILGTAGAGKTTAVAEAMRHSARPVAWLSVDRTDVAPGRLLTYVEAALARRASVADGVATGMLAAGIPHPEAAGVLVEAVSEVPLILVLDDLERLGRSRAAWAVIEALLRYAPPTLRIVLVSRRDIPADLCALPTGSLGAALSELDLAFTEAEAAEALAMLGAADPDAAAVVASTGGWVTGVLFDAWHSDQHVAGLGGGADPLDGYLSSQILDQLSSRAREFLIRTSLLAEVTAARAAALGETSPGESMAELRAAHLPVTWDADGLTLRCHPRFREHLAKRLEARGPLASANLKIAYGRILAREGHHEEAVEVLLLAGATVEAVASAEAEIFRVIERLDVPIAERWLAAFDGVADAASPLVVAELMLSLAGDDYRRGVRVADGLLEIGERDRLAAESDRAAGLMAALYIGAGRLADAHMVLRVAKNGSDVAAARWLLPLYEGRPTTPRPEPHGGEMDAVIWYADYFRGNLGALVEKPLTRWADVVARPWQIGGRAALGQTREALALCEEAGLAGVVPISLGGYVMPDVLVDAGLEQRARAAIAAGRRLAGASGAVDLQLLVGLIEAKLELRLQRSPDAAMAVLDRVAAEGGDHEWPLVQGPWHLWRGLAALLQADDAAARTHLRRSVELLQEGSVGLELPTAAVYLAEAEWRGADEAAADRAADLALEASTRLGSDHRLLQALADFPAVVARRIDAEPGASSRWHRLGRALIAQGTAVTAQLGASVELHEFGPPTLEVDGVLGQARIVKSYELIACLIGRSGAKAKREELLDLLFDGRADASTRSYLRQAIHHARRILPQDGMVIEDGSLRLSGEMSITSESVRFEEMLAEATRLHDDARRAATLAALAIYDRGEYLAGATSPWTESRRETLSAKAIDARAEAAELAFGAGDYAEASELAEAVLDFDPLREAAWRVRMRIANALGDEDGVLAAFRDCERALASIGAEPASGTRQELERLRR